MDKEIRNVNLNLSSKQSFSIDGDPDKIVEVDIHDLGLLNRLKVGLKKMDELQNKWNAISSESNAGNDDASVEEIVDFSDKFDEVEQEMRDLIDGIFDSEGMCTTILGKTSIFSPVNGVFKYEQIISTFCNLYEAEIQKEANKINKRKVEERTAKYVHR